MNLGELLYQSVDSLEKLVQVLSIEFSAPVSVPHADHFVFRHDPRQRSDVLASFLKTVRIMSLLKASLSLLEKGYVQEVYILCRAIDEAVEDIIFLAHHIGDTGTSEEQKRLVNEFYQEEFSDPNDPLSTKERDRVPRRKIRAVLSQMPIGFGDPSTTNQVAKSLFQVFSGFVHGSYVSIMEMYGGRHPKYHTDGMLNSPRISECEENMVNYVFRSILAVEAVSHRVKRKDIVEETLALSRQLAEQTGCIKADGLERLKRRKDRVADKG